MLCLSRSLTCLHPLNCLFILFLQGLIKSAFKDIVSDEINKLMNLSSNDNLKISNSVTEVDDALWDYDGLPDAYQGDCEEMLLEMQHIFYEDLKGESATKGKTFNM